MKSAIERHSELLVSFMENTNVRNLLPQFRNLRRKFDEIKGEKTFSQDPYIDEVCSGRLLNLIRRYFEVYVPGYSIDDERLQSLRVSDLPALEEISEIKRGFGYKSQQEYADLLKKYRNF